MNLKKKLTIFFLAFLVILLSIYSTAFAETSLHDSTKPGPYSVKSAEYRLPAAIYPEILTDRMTEIWGRLFYPQNMVDAGFSKAPLIIMLHGNHSTCGRGVNPRYDASCQYTNSGSCPSGYVVVPNHEGYNYLAENLASWGYLVVSINANRGITCGASARGDWGLNLARGKLILKHLSLLYQWSTVGGAPKTLRLGPQGLVGKIDFATVGLFGHSRGGEGVRAAYNLYLDTGSPWPALIPGLAIKAIFEIGAVDGQTSRVLDANGTVWNQLIPLCDGDVSDFEGRYPFERMLLNTSEPVNAQKSLYEVWGANHNYFNTEWQTSDSYSCSRGKPIFDSEASSSEAQQKVALASVPAFFRSRLGTNVDAVYNQNFNPLDSLPETVTAITQVDRDFTPSPGASETLVIEDFDKQTGLNTSGNTNQSNYITIEHKYLIGAEHPQRVAQIAWKTAGSDAYFETIFAKPGQGRDLREFATLDFRVGRRLGTVPGNPPTDFSVSLEDAAGQFSKEVAVSEYVTITGAGTNSEPVLVTVRMPLSAFKGVDLAAIHGVKFTFNRAKPDKIYLANIRTHRQIGLGSSFKGVNNTNVVPSKFTSNTDLYIEPPKTITPEYVPENFNTVRVVKNPIKGLLGETPTVEIVVASQQPFPAMNRLPVLKIGNKKFMFSRYSDVAQLKELTFTIPADQYNKLSLESEMSVTDGKIWKLGMLKKLIKEGG